MFWTRCFSSDLAVPGMNINVSAGRYQMPDVRNHVILLLPRVPLPFPDEVMPVCLLQRDSVSL